MENAINEEKINQLRKVLSNDECLQLLYAKRMQVYSTSTTVAEIKSGQNKTTRIYEVTQKLSPTAIGLIMKIENEIRERKRFLLMSIKFDDLI